MKQQIEALQFDTQNTCNSKCLYCGCHGPNMKVTPRRMSLETVTSIMRQASQEPLRTVSPWFSGEPMLETRLPEIVKIIRNHTSARIVIFTNGTATKNRDLLTCLGMDDEIHFTVSAVNQEQYAKIHGIDAYSQVIDNIQWLEQQPNHPEIIMRFIYNGLNYQDLDLWKKQWGQFKQRHNRAIINSSFAHAQELSMPENLNLNVRGDPELNEPPCCFWTQCVITVHGFMFQCCKAPGLWGSIHETPLMELWKRKMEDAMQNSFCVECELKTGNERVD